MHEFTHGPNGLTTCAFPVKATTLCLHLKERPTMKRKEVTCQESCNQILS